MCDTKYVFMKEPVKSLECDGVERDEDACRLADTISAAISHH